MKKFLILSLIAFVFVCSTTQAQEPTPTSTPTPAEELAKVCKKITTLPNRGFIYKNSAPLRSGGIGTPLIGYRKEPTLIGNVSLNRSGAIIYSSNGSKLGRCPWTSAHGHAGGRYRCTMGTASLRKRAISRTGSPIVLFRLNGKSCAKVPDAGKCYGSSKGLCNTTIK